MARVKAREIGAFFLIMCAGASPVWGNEPLKITADKALEWHRDQQKIIARGNVIATQGEASIKSATMTATYKEGQKENKFLPQTLRAENDVRISTPDGIAYGDLAIYDISKETAILTGSNLLLESDNFKLSANDKFEYFVKAGKLSASGRAKLIQESEDGNNVIEADKLTANFLSNVGQGNRQLEKMEAIGNVVITTPTETITGNQGFYNKMTNQAELSGDVKIIRGANILEGAVANVDLTANISTLSGGEKDQGRVSGVFYPE